MEDCKSPSALRVLVSPSQQIVGEGARVSFDCLVLGHPIHTIGWIRDFDSTDINPNEVRDCYHYHRM